MPALTIPPLNNKTILITGGNAGIGLATVRALAAQNPSCIYLCSRKTSNGETAAEEIRKNHPNAKIRVLQLDLASLESVKRCAEEFLNEARRLDLLFLNAGVSNLAPGLTEEGFEVQFGVNHMGHALLAQLLLPKMRVPEVKDPRIIVVSSTVAHFLAPKQGNDLSSMRNADAFGSTTTRYAHSKLANILFANKLAEKYPDITTMSLHPGVVKSELLSKSEGSLVNRLLRLVWSVVGLSVEKGAQTQLWCATAQVGKDGVQTGHYYEPFGKDLTGKSKNSVDPKQADELWRWTDEELKKHGAPGWP